MDPTSAKRMTGAVRKPHRVRAGDTDPHTAVAPLWNTFLLRCEWRRRTEAVAMPVGMWVRLRSWASILEMTTTYSPSFILLAPCWRAESSVQP